MMGRHSHPSRSRSVISNKENVSPNSVARLPRKVKKRKASASTVLKTSSSKKVRQERPADPPVTLITLPYDVHHLLLQYLDVTSMECLANTCSHFQSMINGRYLLSVKGDAGSNAAEDQS